MVPTHPDRAGGLGFLSLTVMAFGPVPLAHGALLAGLIGDRIFFHAASLLDFKAQVAVVVAFLLTIVLGPLLLFTPHTCLAKSMSSHCSPKSSPWRRRAKEGRDATVEVALVGAQGGRLEATELLLDGEVVLLSLLDELGDRHLVPRHPGFASTTFRHPLRQYPPGLACRFWRPAVRAVRQPRSRGGGLAHSCGKLPDRVFGTSASTLKSDARGRAWRPKASFPKEGLMKRIRMLGSQQNDRAHLYQTLNLRTVLVP